MRRFLLLTLITPSLATAGDFSEFLPQFGDDRAPAPMVWAAPPDELGIKIARESGRVTVTFVGTLQQSATLLGPWTDVLGSVSPFHPESTSGASFYRARASSPGSIFSSKAVVAMGVTGPLQVHFNLAFAGLPDGFFPPHREKPPFQGVVTLNGNELPVEMHVRGNSSLLECPFPKLRFKMAKNIRDGTPFFDARAIKIGTHCADGGRGSIGRLRDERATFREVLAYETMNLMGFLSPRVRRAEIEFRDISPTNLTSDGGWIVLRKAMLLEDPDVVGERLSGRALNTAELAALTNAAFEEQLIIDLRFFHTLIGNWDYQLSVDGQGLANTDVLVMSDGKYVPMAGDFDLASWVTGAVRATFPRTYHPELPDIDRAARFSLEQIRELVNPEQFIAAQKRFEERRGALVSLVASAEIDDLGRTNAVEHIEAFFRALTTIE